MKNQYVGDINDYRKYGLIDLITETFEDNILIAWMLTEDNGNNEGNEIGYLLNPGKYRGFNEFIFDELKKIVLKKIEVAGQESKINYIEAIENILFKRYKNFDFIDDFIQDKSENRAAYFENVYARAEGNEIIFLDPDNGLENKSVKRGTKDSSKYVYWDEVKELFKMGKDLLIYQHIPREKEFTARIASECRSKLFGARIIPIKTSNVLFILIVNVKRSDDDLNRLKKSLNRWKGELNLEPL